MVKSNEMNINCLTFYQDVDSWMESLREKLLNTIVLTNPKQNEHAIENDQRTTHISIC